jgi:hypothetical protein
MISETLYGTWEYLRLTIGTGNRQVEFIEGTNCVSVHLSSILSAARNQLSVYELLTLDFVNPRCHVALQTDPVRAGKPLTGVPKLVLMTIFGHDPFSWPYMVIA